MSATVDSRVVEMRFDNKQFESGVATSMNSLDKFQRSLKMEGATKGLASVQASANKINFSNIENMATRAGFHIQDVWQKVASVFEYQIAAKIVNAGKNMAAALTIEPMKTGLSEYETQINAVQTILANTESKGSTLDQVNSALDTLNTYADKTIYNFTEMTRNIGTFTAAGVDLDTSVNAIQGIANLAAVSGSSSQQASTAMYQLSQALSSGTVKLMDWNSVVNAGMGGQVFQDALKETARVHGVNVDKMIEKHGSFRETLQEGWITSDILTETLSHFTMAAEEGSAQWEQYKKSLMDQGYSEEQAASILKLSNTATNAATKVKTATQLWDTLKETAQSGWTQTWEIILGDFEEAKALFSGMYETLSPIIEATSEARNKLLEGAMTSNWDKMVTKINEAGIETDRFEEKLRSTAEAHGVDVDKIVEEYGSLEKAFKSGAISSDILKEAVKGLEGKLVDLSGITRNLERGMNGDDVKKVQKSLEELGYSLGEAGADGKFGKATQDAVKAFQELKGLEVTGIVDDKTIKALEEAGGKADGLSESIGGLIDDIDKLGGRELLIESLKNVFNGLVSIVKPIGKAFRDIFPATTVEQLYSFIESIHNFTKKLTLSDKASENLRRTFRGVFALMDIGKQIFFGVTKALSPLFGKVTELSGGLLGFTGNIGDWIVGLSESLRASDFFDKAMVKVANAIEKAKVAFEKIKDALKKVKAAFETAGEKIGNALGKVKSFFKPVSEGVKTFGEEVSKTVSAAADNVKERLGPLAILGSFIKGVFVALGKAVKKAFPYIAKAAQGIGKVFGDLMQRIAESIQNADYDALFDLTSSGIIATIGVFIAKFIKSGSNLVDSAAGFVENISGIFSGLKDCLGAFTESIKADALRKIAIAVGILAVSLLILSFIPSEKLTDALLTITTLFTELMITMKIFGNMGEMKGIGKTSTSIIKLASGLLILSVALKIMSTMSWEGMGVALVSMSVGLGELVAAVWLLSKIPEKNLKKATKAVKKLASTLIILSIALKIMSTMSWEGMGVALISMTVGLGELVAAVWLLSKIPEKNLRKSTSAVKKLASSLLVLSIALKIMSTMSWAGMGVALISMTVSLAALVAAVKLLPKDTASKAAGLVGLATAMVILGAALKIMASMSWDELAVGLVALCGSLAVLVGAMQLMKKAIPGAIAMMIVAPAMVVLAGALKILGGLSWNEVAVGLVTLGGALLIIAGAMQLMKKAIVGAAALMIVTAALAVLAPVLKVLGSMSLSEIGKALLVLAGAFAVLGVAALVLKPVVPTMIKLAGAFVLLGVACLAIGAGILMIGVGITALAGALAAGGAAIVTFVSSIISLIPFIIEQIGLGIVKLVQVIAGAASTICNAIAVIIVAVVDALVIAVPKLVEGLLVLIKELLTSLVAHLPTIVDHLVNLIVSLLNLLAQKMPEIMDAIFTFIVSIIDCLAANIMRVVEPILNFIGTIFKGIANILGPIVQEVIAPILSVLASLFVGLFEAMAPYIPAISALVTIMTDAITYSIVQVTKTLAPFIPVIANAIVMITDIIADSIVRITEALAPFIPDITQMITEITRILTDAIVKITEVLAPFLPDLKEILLGITESFTVLIQEIAPITDSLKELIGTLGDKIIGIMNEVKETLAVTGDVISETLGGISEVFDSAFNGIATVLDSVGGSIKSVLDGIAGVIESIGNAALNAGTGFENLANGVKTITNLPIVDMTASLGAVATGISGIAAYSGDLAAAGAGMTQLSDGARSAATAFDVMVGNATIVFSIFSTEKVTVEGVVTAFKNLKKAIQDISGLSIETVTTGIGDIASKSDALAKAGSGMSQLATGAMLASTGFHAISTNSAVMVDKLSSIGAIIEGVVTALQNGAKNMQAAGTSLITKAISGIDSEKKKFIETAKTVIKQFIDTIDGHLDSAKKVCTSLASACAHAISSKVGLFNSAGRDMVRGFANGIGVNTYLATAKARAMAKAAADAAKKELDEHSPSKVGYGIGNYFGVAFVNGISDNIKSAYKVSTNLASSARDGMNQAISKINTILSSDVDAQPTIRPVVDLSDVRSGASAISGMLNLDSQVGVRANLAAISATMSQRGQNGFNSEVVSAINKLRKDIANIGGGDTYQVNGVTYDDGSNVTEAVKAIVRHARIERRV